MRNRIIVAFIDLVLPLPAKRDLEVFAMTSTASSEYRYWASAKFSLAISRKRPYSAGYVRLTYISVYGIYTSMIKIQLAEILEGRGQTVYSLWKQTGIRYATIWQMSKGEIARLNLDVLDRICEVLECQPGDLLVRVEDRKKRKRGR